MSAVTHWNKGYFNFDAPASSCIDIDAFASPYFFFQIQVTESSVCNIQTQVFSGCVANDEGVMWIKLWSLWSQHSELRCLDQPKNIGKKPDVTRNCSSTKSLVLEVEVYTSWISTNPDDRCPCTVTLFWSPYIQNVKPGWSTWILPIFHLDQKWKSPLKWVTPSETPKALQASECSPLRKNHSPPV